MSCWILKGPWGSWSPDLGGGDQIAGRCPSCRDLPPAPRIQSLSARSFFRQEGRWVGIKKKSGKAVQSVECVLQTSGRNHCDFCFLSFELITVLLLESGGTSPFILEK